MKDSKDYNMMNEAIYQVKLCISATQNKIALYTKELRVLEKQLETLEIIKNDKKYE